MLGSWEGDHFGPLWCASWATPSPLCDEILWGHLSKAFYTSRGLKCTQSHAPGLICSGNIDLTWALLKGNVGKSYHHLPCSKNRFFSKSALGNISVRVVLFSHTCLLRLKINSVTKSLAGPSSVNIFHSYLLSGDVSSFDLVLGFGQWARPDTTHSSWAISKDISFRNSCEFSQRVSDEQATAQNQKRWKERKSASNRILGKRGGGMAVPISHDPNDLKLGG